MAPDSLFKNSNIKQVIEKFYKKGFFLSPEVVDSLSSSEVNLDTAYLSLDEKTEAVVLNNLVLKNIEKNTLCSLNWADFDQAVVEKEIKGFSKLYDSFVSLFFDEPGKQSEEQDAAEISQAPKQAPAEAQNKSQTDARVEALSEKSENVVFGEESRMQAKAAESTNAECSDLPEVELLFDYNDFEVKRSVENFVDYYNYRFQYLSGLVVNRSEMGSPVSIARLKDAGECSVIGLVYEMSKKNNIILKVEDKSGMVRVFISKENPELFSKAENLVLDQAVGINGTYKNGAIYAKSIIEPGIPQAAPIKKCNEDINVAFIGDLHVGSNLFLEKEFMAFVSWINCSYGSDKHKALAEKTRYLFVVGDLIDGVGIYPGQESELSIKSVYKQYEKVAELLSKIRKDIRIIIIPGNHDALRLAEPQPRLYKEFAGQLYALENVVMLTNPGYVKIHKSKEFEGLKVLLYHGFGFDYYFSSVESIRKNGGYHRPDLLMKMLLEKRHLIPSHGCTPFIPDPNEDPMLIKEIPDVFVTGHIHYTCVSNIGNTVLLSASAWQDKTSFQEKLGHDPEPCRVPVLNLKTRKINVLRFG
ncbi:MAG TPA: hypothetical protein ENN46_01080 [Candidatus Woesearchaeota archaeon]|nr:hypothetical protein [Candidatus Woesearchaeota archaeon]